MRKAYLLFTLLVVGLASCKPNRNDKATTYNVSNVHDIELTQGEEYSYELFLSYIGPVQENVTLDIEGLPEGITYDFSKWGGIPSFNTEVTLRNNSAEPGTYECVLTTTGDKTGEKSYDFTVTVKTEPLCGTLGTYTYNLTSLCDPSLFGGLLTTSETVTAAMPPVENAVNPVRFANFGGYSGLIVQGKINCTNNKVEIPLQSVGTNLEISGTGTFTSAGMTISYTIYNNGVQTPCSFTMIKTN
jgi:hypothetical protein